MISYGHAGARRATCAPGTRCRSSRRILHQAATFRRRARASDDQADAVVIGAGVIGASIALELARTRPNGALRRQGRRAWRRFHQRVVGAHPVQLQHDRRGADGVGVGPVLAPLGRAPRCRRPRRHVLVRPTPACSSSTRPAAPCPRVTALWDEVGIPYERSDADELARRYPVLDTGAYFPPKTIDDPPSPTTPPIELTRGVRPERGLHRRPAARDAQHRPCRPSPRRPLPVPATGGRGAARRRPGARRATGRRLDDRRAGGGERCRPALGSHERAGRRHRRHAHRSSRAAPRGVRRPGAGGVVARRGMRRS